MLVFDLEYILENITFSKRKQFSFCLANSTTTTTQANCLSLFGPTLPLVEQKKNLETNKKLIIMICCMFSFLFFFTYQILIET